MKIKVKKEAVGAKCDQWCQVDAIIAGNLKVTLLGTGEKALVAPSEVCGLAFSDQLEIDFNVSTYMRRSQ
jgi:hypothetical protein